MNKQYRCSLSQLLFSYWKGEERKKAWLMGILIAALTIAAVYMTLLLNDWFNSFYSALQNYDRQAIYHGLIQFTGYAFAYIAFSVYADYFQQKLALRWRRWMTEKYLARWTAGDMYYRMEVFSGGRGDNPDQRISEDIDSFTSQSLSLMQGLLQAITTIVCFIVVLWNLSETLTFTLWGHTFHLEGYLVWAALLYSAAGTWVTHKVGKKLIALNYEQQKREANFRFGMMRLRDTAESVAFYHGGSREKETLFSRFLQVASNKYVIIRKNKQLSWLTSSYGQIAIIFPFVVAAPRYLTRKISLGGLMQIANCFGKVQDSLSYLVNAYTGIASWQACANRLRAFTDHMEAQTKAAQQAEKKLRITRGGHVLALHDVQVDLPNGEELLRHVSMTFKEGEKVIIRGSSGAGKSTLLRVLAGLWPYAEGKMELPAEGAMLFIPQKPYLPFGTLRHALSYPGEDAGDDALIPLMKQCRMEKHIDQLDTQGDWMQVLSLGEQQKAAFVRILLQRPAWLFLDEASSAMDEDTEAALYGLLTHLPSTIISVGHRSTLDKFHERSVEI